MKYIQYITITLLLSIGIAQISKAQSIDSIANQKVGYLKKVLVLSDNQYNTVKDAYATMLTDMNNVDISEGRTIRLVQINKTYHTALKNILTKEQWVIYETKRQTMQQAFEQHIQNKKIKYTLLNNQ